MPEPDPERHPPEPEDVERRWSEIVEQLGPLGEDTESGQGLAPGPRDHTVDEEILGEIDAFVPPDPPALGSGRPAVVLSLIGLLGGPAGLLLASILWPGIPGLITTVLVVAFIAGAVGLFLTLPRSRDRGGYDDGAQV